MRLSASKLLLLVALLTEAFPVFAQNPVRWSITSGQSKAVSDGDTFGVSVSAQIDPSWHVYAMTEPPGGPVALVITVPFTQPFTLFGEIESPFPRIAFDPNFNIDTQFFEDSASFSVPIHVETAPSGPQTLSVVVRYQACNDRLCLPPTDEELKLALSVRNGIAGNVSDDTAVLPAPTSPVSSAPPAGAEGAEKPAPVPDMAAGSARASTLAGYVSLAMIMGALSLLTPCVFPMVPITVSYFTRRAGITRRDAISQALLYGLGIVLTFTGLGLTIALGFGASGLNRFAADPWLNLFITGLFIAFALSLFGIFEIKLPARLVSVAARSDEGRGRHFGTLLMGLAFTLTSFTCTAPFLGALFVVASQGDWHWPLAGMLGFSMVFATPFVILALAPRLLWALPRSGVWLVAVKAAMGLLELAAAMKFLSNADLVWGWGIFTRSVVIMSWMVIGGFLILYFSGAFRLGLPAELGRPGAARWALMTGVAILVVWLGTGLQGRRLGELEAFLPPADVRALSSSELAWLMNDYDAALTEARRQDRPILVDFTGYTCTNCRWMEANMFPRPEVERELARYIRLRLYTDGRGDMYRKFQQMQRDTFGTVALPYYAVLTPAGKPVLAFGGLTRDPNEYLMFLRKGLE